MLKEMKVEALTVTVNSVHVCGGMCELTRRILSNESVLIALIEMTALEKLYAASIIAAFILDCVVLIGALPKKGNSGQANS